MDRRYPCSDSPTFFADLLSTSTFSGAATLFHGLNYSHRIKLFFHSGGMLGLVHLYRIACHVRLPLVKPEKPICS
jgi:hypothetical protein